MFRQKLAPILLIGSLLMFFAEVCSGASQTWFADLRRITMVFPIYLAHVLFFLYIAVKAKKTSLFQLYLFGMMFALYESWITKVLWTGYKLEGGAGICTVFGICIPEFPVLVLFWHPVMSFIVPVLVYEIMTKSALEGHERILTKSAKKSVLIILCLIMLGPYIANGNGMDMMSANASIAGSVLIITLLYCLTKDVNLKNVIVGKKGFVLVTAYLIILYLITFLFSQPEQIPRSIVPYIPIFVFYLIPAVMLKSTDRVGQEIRTLTKQHYTVKDLLIFFAVLTASANIACILPDIGRMVVILVYYTIILAGIVIFAYAVIHSIRKIIRHMRKQRI
jgi:hypothetical protein